MINVPHIVWLTCWWLFYHLVLAHGSHYAILYLHNVRNITFETIQGIPVILVSPSNFFICVTAGGKLLWFLSHTHPIMKPVSPAHRCPVKKLPSPNIPWNHLVLRPFSVERSWLNGRTALLLHYLTPTKPPKVPPKAWRLFAPWMLLYSKSCYMNHFFCFSH